jgi:uncharacterized Zn finger protein
MRDQWHVTDDNGSGKGLAVRSRRGPIGVTWWARRWLSLCESAAAPRDLEAGRRLARQARVTELTIAPGRVRAVVEESHQQPLPVEFVVAPLTAAQQQLLVSLLLRDTLALATLFADRLPENLETFGAQAGCRLFPDGDLKPNCGCGVRAGTCRHAIAAASVAAERFDLEPFLLLAWHGLDRARFANLVRAAWGAPPVPERRSAEAPPLASQMADFHRCPVPLPANSGSVDLPPLNVLECLGEPPFFPPDEPLPEPTLGELYRP